MSSKERRKTLWSRSSTLSKSFVTYLNPLFSNGGRRAFTTDAGVDSAKRTAEDLPMVLGSFRQTLRVFYFTLCGQTQSNKRESFRVLLRRLFADSSKVLTVLCLMFSVVSLAIEYLRGGNGMLRCVMLWWTLRVECLPACAEFCSQHIFLLDAPDTDKLIFCGG